MARMGTIWRAARLFDLKPVDRQAVETTVKAFNDPTGPRRKKRTKAKRLAARQMQRAKWEREERPHWKK